MKRIVSLLLLFALVFALSSCGTAPSEDPVPDTEPAPATEPSEDPAPEEPSEESAEFRLGTVENGVYRNAFLGIGFRLDENGMSESVPEGNSTYRTEAEDIEAAFAEGSIVDLFCKNYEGTVYLTDDFSRLVSVDIYNKDADAQEVMENKMAERVERLKGSSNIFDVEYDKVKTNIGGIKFYGFDDYYHFNGDTDLMGERHLAYNKDGYLFYIVIVSVQMNDETLTYDDIKADLDNIEKNFFFAV